MCWERQYHYIYKIYFVSIISVKETLVFFLSLFFALGSQRFVTSRMRMWGPSWRTFSSVMQEKMNSYCINRYKWHITTFSHNLVVKDRLFFTITLSVLMPVCMLLVSWCSMKSGKRAKCLCNLIIIWVCNRCQRNKWTASTASFLQTRSDTWPGCS